jgi:hypothetical protein
MVFKVRKLVTMVVERVSSQVATESTLKKTTFSAFRENALAGRHAKQIEHHLEATEELLKNDRKQSQELHFNEKKELEAALSAKQEALKANISKYFDQRVVPAVQNSHMKKSGFSCWASEFLTWVHANHKEELQKATNARHEALKANISKYFDQRIIPAVQEGHLKKSAFSFWASEFMSSRHETVTSEKNSVQRETTMAATKFQEEMMMKEQKMRNEMKAKAEEMLVSHASEIQNKNSEILKKDGEIEKKESEIEKKESEIQKKNSEIQNKEIELSQVEQAAFERHKEMLNAQADRQKKLLANWFASDKTRRDKSSDGVFGYSSRGIFASWKEFAIHRRYKKREDEMQDDFEANHQEQLKLKQEALLREQQQHLSNKSSSLVKYFSEKVAPAVHDSAAKKESFGGWKEGFLHGIYARREELVLQMELQDIKARELHTKVRSDMMVKYFSEKVAPTIHDIAAKKEGFGEWKQRFIHVGYAIREQEVS